MSDLLVMTWTFLWLSLLCVGGGLGVVPEMQRQVALNHGWLTTREFVDGYTLAQLTPGPNMLVVAFVGYRAHGVLGSIAATVAMFLPSAVFATFVADRWQRLRGHRWAQPIERALLPIGIGLSSAGVYTLAHSALQDVTTIALALAAALVLYAGRAPAMLVVVLGGVVGWLLS
ncbi:MAG TPA: chromate transporter [Methylomirabilota bacterium]|nr:chromate transporter [Methylomirabilota bacterium]